MNRPWLSVLIPTYNGEAYLAEAMDSIVAQCDSHIECIAVDDGSTDSTIPILQKYQRDLSLKIIRRQRQGNWVSNTNHALALATADYACFLHQDDLWLPHRLTVMKQIIQQSPQVKFFLHASRYLDHHGNDLGIWQCSLPASPNLIHSDLMIERLLIQNFISIPAPIFKSECARQIGGLDSTLWYTADWDFWLRISACGDTLYYPEALSGFRIHPGSQTIVRSLESSDFRLQLESVLERNFSDWAAPGKRRQHVKKVARFSIEVNIALASTVHGQKPNFFRLLVQFLKLGFAGWIMYIRDSRIHERVLARMRAKLRPNSLSG